MGEEAVLVVSLDKAILHGKEHRKPYKGAKAIDGTCRNHGSCRWCVENRRHKMRDKHPERLRIDRINARPGSAILAYQFGSDINEE